MSNHILIATGLYPPEIGGPATFSAFFEKELKDRNIPCTVVPFSSVRWLPKILRHVAYFLKVLFAFRKDSIVLALDPVSVGLPTLYAARLRGKKFYLRAGGDYAWEQATNRWGFKGIPEEFPGDFKLPITGKLLVWTERHVAKHARKILTQSGHLASIVARWGVPAEKIAVIPNSVELPPLPSREEARKEFGFGDEPVIVSAARLVPWKGMSALIHAIREIRDARASAQLVIAGDGPERALLEAQGRSISAIFLGNISKEKLMTLLRAADVFVLNTRYEGFSHQILEALAVGVPVVTTDIPANKELAEEGVTALTVPWNDEKALVEAIQRILGDTELAKRLSEGGKKRAEAFTPDRTFKGTMEALQLDF